MTGVDHPIDRDVPLGDEELVAFAGATRGLVVEEAVVAEAWIAGIVDLDQHRGDATGGASSAALAVGSGRALTATIAAVGRLLCIGDLNADITVTTEHEIAPGSDTPGEIGLAAGGSAANVAAGAARAGTETHFVGVVGDDLLGRFLADELAGHGVEVHPIVREGATSRSIAALISPTGERSMVSDLAGATVLCVDDIDHAWFDGVDWMHLTAYTWFPPGGDIVVARLVDLATERRIAWSIDPSSAKMLATRRSVATALDAFGGAAVMFPSRDEAALLTGHDDATASATALLDVAETVVVTCGADGAIVARRGVEPFRVDAHAVDVVNTLGAGDAFAAGFLASRVAGRDDEVSAAAGTVAAAAAVTRWSAR